MSGAAATRLAGRILLSLSAATAAVLIAAVGVSAASTSIDSSRPAGGLELVPAAELDAVEQVPGAVVERVLTLRNAGNTAYRTVEIGSAAAGGPVAGLRLRVTRCATGWQLAAAGPHCAGRESVLAAGAVGASFTLADSAALQPGGRDSLLVALTLPARSGVVARVTYSAVGR